MAKQELPAFCISKGNSKKFQKVIKQYQDNNINYFLSSKDKGDNLVFDINKLTNFYVDPVSAVSILVFDKQYLIIDRTMTEILGSSCEIPLIAKEVDKILLAEFKNE
jgi:hypothetical protein